MESMDKEFCQLSTELLDQSMVKIRHCLGQLSEQQLWWRTQPPINSVGNLCLHLAGNLRQWGITPLTGEADQRMREMEFDDAIRVSKSQVANTLESVVDEAKKFWLDLEQETLLKKTTIQGFDVTIMHAISHTSSHFVGHTHQIIMLTRMQLGHEYRFQWSPDDGRDSVPI